jgi:hypothetical protein
MVPHVGVRWKGMGGFWEWRDYKYFFLGGDMENDCGKKSVKAMSNNATPEGFRIV